MPILNSDLFNWVVLPILIFICRIIDVSIGTLRIMFVSKGNKVLTPILGFLEVLIWLIAMGQIMKNLDNIMCYVAYAGGFAAGNYVGIMLEEKLAVGMYSIRIFIPKQHSIQIRQDFTKAGFGLTVLEGYGSKGEMMVLYSIFKRKDRQKIFDIIAKQKQKFFYCIEDVKTVNRGIFPEALNIKRKHVRLMRNRK